MGLEQVIILTKEQIDRRAEELKKEVCERLDSQADGLKSQLDNMASLSMPNDLVDAMLEKDAKIWVSKTVGISYPESLTMQNSSRNLFFEQNAREPSFRLSPGAYRLVLLAFPQDYELDNNGAFVDDYGQQTRPEV